MRISNAAGRFEYVEAGDTLLTLGGMAVNSPASGKVIGWNEDPTTDKPLITIQIAKSQIPRGLPQYCESVHLETFDFFYYRPPIKGSDMQGDFMNQTLEARLVYGVVTPKQYSLADPIDTQMEIPEELIHPNPILNFETTNSG